MRRWCTDGRLRREVPASKSVFTNSLLRLRGGISATQGLSHRCLHRTKNPGTWMHVRAFSRSRFLARPTLLASYNRKLTKVSSHVREVGSKHRAPVRSRIEQILDQNMIEGVEGTLWRADHRGTRLLGELPWRAKKEETNSCLAQRGSPRVTVWKVAGGGYVYV